MFRPRSPRQTPPRDRSPPARRRIATASSDQSPFLPCGSEAAMPPRRSSKRPAFRATPPNLAQDFKPDVAAARGVVERALERGRTWLDPIDITQLLAAYSIPIAPALLARNGEEAAAAARPFLAEGSGVVVKILSPDIVHKSEVGGVRLNLTSERAVRDAVADILARARALRPDARITGVTIHPMVLRPKARELIAGIADDPTLGPVIVFGRGGTAVEVI